jgi:hypothetical protein
MMKRGHVDELGSAYRLVALAAVMQCHCSAPIGRDSALVQGSPEQNQAIQDAFSYVKTILFIEYVIVFAFYWINIEQ